MAAGCTSSTGRSQVSDQYLPGVHNPPCDEDCCEPWVRDPISDTYEEHYWSEYPDPRWEWLEVMSFSDPGPRYIRGACRHLEREEVRSVMTGETLAWLCLTCDMQLDV